MIALLLCCLLDSGSAKASSSIPSAALADFAFDQHPGAALPLDTRLRDETGAAVRLGDFFGAKPVVLDFEYFHCPGLCGLVLDHLATTLTQIALQPGRDYQLVAISIDPTETPADAAALKARHLGEPRFAAADGGIHFLVGDPAAVRAVADRAGFRYRYDEAIRQFAHPAGIVIASPRGVVSRYLLGVDYTPLDLRLGLVEAGQGTVAAPAAHLLLLCYGYDPATGRYSLAIHKLLEIVAALTVLLLVGLWLAIARGGRRRARGGGRLGGRGGGPGGGTPVRDGP